MISDTPNAEFLDGNNYAVFVDGFKRASFSEVSEIKAKVAPIKHWEGGSAIANKRPSKRVEWDPVTLKRGTTSDLDIYAWFATTANAVAAGAGNNAVGLAASAVKRNVEIVSYRRDGEELGRWLLAGAWISESSIGPWNAGADEVLIESITLEYDFADRVA